MVALAFFVIWEMTDEHPVVNLRLFAHRNFRFGNYRVGSGYAGFFDQPILLQWLQTRLGYNRDLGRFCRGAVGHSAGAAVARR